MTLDEGIVRTGRIGLGLAAAAGLAACAPQATETGITDPYEAENRGVHELNKQFDTLLLKPASSAMDEVVPDPVLIGLRNATENLEIPGDVVNNLLQLRLGMATENTLRFVINSTIGIGGFFDPAGELGLHGDSTYFGETLHVWGFPEGSYDELPLIGPSTDRDTVGFVIGSQMNPLAYIVTPEQAVGMLVLEGVSIVIDRGRYSDTFDSVLYESADSYAQTRLLYLQNRRFELGQTEAGTDDDFLDPYGDDSDSAGGGAVPPGFEDPYAE